MLEKIFGKRSTGIIYIICAAVLLLSFGGAALSYILVDTYDLYTLIGQAVLTACSLALISAPVIIQKKFRLYIPPLIEISLCAFMLLYYGSTLVPQLAIASEALPAIGGFVLAMAIFTVLYSVFDHRAIRQKKRTKVWLVSLLSFAGAALLILIIAILMYAVSALRDETPDIFYYLTQASYFQGGGALFCAIAFFTVRSRSGKNFRIHSFRNAEEAKRSAEESKNRTQVAVIENITRDKTDYRKLFRSAKAKFFFVRILWLAVYVGYLVHACLVFSKLGGWGYAILFALFSAFVLMAAVYIYEYVLFRRGELNQRLRAMKIAKAAARIYALALIFVAMFYAGYRENELSTFISVCMSLVNMGSLFYNLFGKKPRKYPSVRKKRSAEGDPLSAKGAERADMSQGEEAAPAEEG